MTKHTKPTTYEKFRNALIPQAVAYADSKSGQRPDPETTEYQEWAATWNRHFHGEMDRLWRRAVTRDRVETLTSQIDDLTRQRAELEAQV